jgi:hypothetical protein
MSKEIRLDPLNCIFFIYQSFALNSDGILDDREKKIITELMYRWSGNDINTLSDVVNVTENWSKSNIKSKNDQVSVMFSMIDFLKENEDFDIIQREYFLMDIRNISRSNKNFHPQQKIWHDMIAKSLGLGIRISDNSLENINDTLENVKKKKIGFRK